MITMSYLTVFPKCFYNQLKRQSEKRVYSQESVSLGRQPYLTLFVVSVRRSPSTTREQYNSIITVMILKLSQIRRPQYLKLDCLILSPIYQALRQLCFFISLREATISMRKVTIVRQPRVQQQQLGSDQISQIINAAAAKPIQRIARGPIRNRDANINYDLRNQYMCNVNPYVLKQHNMPYQYQLAIQHCLTIKMQKSDQWVIGQVSNETLSFDGQSIDQYSDQNYVIDERAFII